MILMSRMRGKSQLRREKHLPRFDLLSFLPPLEGVISSLPLCVQIYGAQFMETSAKTGYNVGNCLMNLVR